MVVSSNIPIQIKGGNPLQGRVRIQGSKNASLPVLAATLLIAGQCTLDNCPQIMDVVCMQKLLEQDVYKRQVYLHHNRESVLRWS